MLLFITSCALKTPKDPDTETAARVNPSELVRAFENKIAIRLIDTLIISPAAVPTRQSLEDKLDKTIKVLEQLNRLNTRLLTAGNTQAIHQVEMLRLSQTSRLDLWDGTNHLNLLQDLLPPLVFSRAGSRNPGTITAKIMRTPSALSRLQAIIETQKTKGIVYPGSVIGYAVDHLRKIGATDNNPLLDRYKQLLQYSTLDHAQQLKRYEGFHESYRAYLNPAYAQFSDFLTAYAKGERQSSDSTGIKIGGIGFIDEKIDADLSHNLLQKLEADLALVQHRIELKCKKQGASLQHIYRDPRYSMRNGKNSYQTLLNLVSVYVLDIQPALRQWFFRLPVFDVLIVANDLNAPEVFSYQDGQVRFYLPALAELPTFELETLAYQYAAPGHHLINDRITLFPDASRLAKAYRRGWSNYALQLPWRARQTGGYFSENLAQLGFHVRSQFAVVSAIIDTNIQLGRWSEGKSIQFISDNTPYSTTSIERQVQWIIANPGIAVRSYLIGKELQSLREFATMKLNLSVPEFHRIVLAYSPASITFLKNEMRDILAGN